MSQVDDRSASAVSGALRDPPRVRCAHAIALIGLDRAAWRTAPGIRLAASPAKTPISVYDPEG